MSRHLFTPERKTGVVRWAGAGHSEGLDAWLGADVRPSDAPDVASVGNPADWTAPDHQVALAYDTAEQGLPAGVRAVVQEGSRRLMFESDDYEILLRVASDRHTQRHELAGQILYEGLPLPGATVRLDRGGPPSTTSTDRDGGFRLPPLMQGAYALRIAVAGAVLTTPPIALG